MTVILHQGTNVAILLCVGGYMEIKRYCQIIGAIFLGIGILGFIPGVSMLPAHHMEPSTSGLLFGIFPINALHNFVHIAFGIWALSASKKLENCRIFCAANAIIYGVLAVFGLIPGLNTMFGIMPLYGNLVWLHGLIALSSAYFAWGWHPRTMRMGT
jgi:hypothetical protein